MGTRAWQPVYKTRDARTLGPLARMLRAAGRLLRTVPGLARRGRQSTCRKGRRSAGPITRLWPGTTRTRRWAERQPQQEAPLRKPVLLVGHQRQKHLPPPPRQATRVSAHASSSALFRRRWAWISPARPWRGGLSVPRHEPGNRRRLDRRTWLIPTSSGGVFAAQLRRASGR